MSYIVSRHLKYRAITDRVKEQRDLLGLTQNQVADEFNSLSGRNIHKDTYKKWENGERCYEKEWVEVVAKTLGLSLHDIAFIGEERIYYEQ